MRHDSNTVLKIILDLLMLGVVLLMMAQDKQTPSWWLLVWVLAALVTDIKELR